MKHADFLIVLISFTFWVQRERERLIMGAGENALSQSSFLKFTIFKSLTKQTKSKSKGWNSSPNEINWRYAKIFYLREYLWTYFKHQLITSTYSSVGNYTFLLCVKLQDRFIKYWDPKHWFIACFAQVYITLLCIYKWKLLHITISFPILPSIMGKNTIANVGLTWCVYRIAY